MITLEQVQAYVRQEFNEQDGSDRIEDRGFAFLVETQPREFLDGDHTKGLLGGSPLLILKETGDIYSFGSVPFNSSTGVDVLNAKSADEFYVALKEREAANESGFVHGRVG